MVTSRLCSITSERTSYSLGRRVGGPQTLATASCCATEIVRSTLKTRPFLSINYRLCLVAVVLLELAVVVVVVVVVVGGGGGGGGGGVAASAVVVQGRAIPLQAWTGPEGSRSLRLPEFKIIST